MCKDGQICCANECCTGTLCSGTSGNCNCGFPQPGDDGTCDVDDTCAKAFLTITAIAGIGAAVFCVLSICGAAWFFGFCMQRQQSQVLFIGGDNGDNREYLVAPQEAAKIQN